MAGARGPLAGTRARGSPGRAAALAHLVRVKRLDLGEIVSLLKIVAGGAGVRGSLY